MLPRVLKSKDEVTQGKTSIEQIHIIACNFANNSEDCLQFQRNELFNQNRGISYSTQSREADVVTLIKICCMIYYCRNIKNVSRPRPFEYLAKRRHHTAEQVLAALL